MKFPIVRNFCLAFALASSALAQAPIEPPVVPASIEAANEEDEEESSGQPQPALGEVPPTTLSIIEFQADEIGLVLRTLARQARINLVLSDKATRSGTVTMRLANRTPKDAIEAIVMDRGLIMEEVNGVHFIKTNAEIANEPTPKQLERLTNSVVAPLGKLKGEYYRQLVQSGVPEATAASVILNEELSKSALGAPARKTDLSEDDNADPKDWIAWSVIGATGLDLMQRMPLLVLHFILAIAVWATARRAQRSGITLTFLSPFFWGVATLIGGVLVAGLYWVIHHSSLRLTNESVC